MNKQILLKVYLELFLIFSGKANSWFKKNTNKNRGNNCSVFFFELAKEELLNSLNGND